MIDEKLDRLRQKILRLKQKEVASRLKEKKLKIRLEKITGKMHRQNDRFFTQWIALTFTCFDYAWLKFMYPDMTIRKASTLLEQPKSTLYDRVSSVFAKYDIWERHLVPLAKQGSYHFIRIIYAYELVRSDYKMSVKTFCSIYSLPYNTIRSQINKRDAEKVLTYATHFYLLYPPGEDTAPMQTSYTTIDVTEEVLNIFTKRHLM